MSRQTILHLLRDAGENYVSGEHISEELGITRAAIWKAVDMLRRDGYEIEARSGCGYRLQRVPDRLATEIIAPMYHTTVVGRELICLSQVDSTNSYAKTLAAAGAAEGTVVVADCQSGGRGRNGRVFESPPGKGIYLTVILRPTISIENLPSITALAAVAMCRAVKRVCALEPQIKWTNDMVWKGKKICGILTELSLEGESGRVDSVVLGIGMNVNHKAADFSDEVAAMATSLATALGHPVERAALAAAMIEELDRMNDRLGGDYSAELADYRRVCVTLGQMVRVTGAGETFYGTALDVDDQFGLVLQKETGETVVLRSGEVSVRGMYGYV